MKKYLESRAWDFILCVCMSVGLSFNIFAGFSMTDPLAQSIPAVAGLTVAFTALLFAASYNKKTVLVAAGLGVSGLAAAVIAFQNTGVLNTTDTIDSNPVLFWIIVITVALCVFLAGRTKAGIIVLFITVTAVVSVFDFLQYPVALAGYLVFVGCSIALLLYRIYCISLLKSHIGTIRFSAYFAQSAVVAVLVLSIAAGGFYGIVDRLKPPTDDIKLQSILMSLQILEKLGVSSKTELPSQSNYSNNLNNTKRTSKDQGDNTNSSADTSSNDSISQGGDIVALLSNAFIDAMAITYDENKRPWFIAIIALAALVLASPPFIRILLRRRWYKGVLAAGREDGAIRMYLYYIKKMRKAGLKKEKNITLIEFSKNLQRDSKCFSGEDADFQKITEIYLRLIYGCQRISDDDHRLFLKFHSGFYRNLRHEMGTPKYLLKFLTI